MNKKEIIKLIEGDLDEDRAKKVIEWLLKNKKELNTYHILKAEHTAKLLGGSKNQDSGGFSKKFTNNFLKYIAIFVLLFVGAFYINEIGFEKDTSENPMVLITTSVGEKEEIILSDGTKIVMNSNSALSYPTRFTGLTREVILKGEAFFEVTENKERPFIVNTNEGMNIRVLGTEFNVKSYPEDKEIETTLVTGKVQVVEKKDNKTVLLYPSQRATYVKTDGKLIIDQVKTENYTSWKDGKLIYDETPLKYVIKDLERTYNVTFHINSEELLDYKYKGVFDNLNLQEVLDLFELSSPIKYTLKNDYVILEKRI